MFIINFLMNFWVYAKANKLKNICAKARYDRLKIIGGTVHDARNFTFWKNLFKVFGREK